MKAVVLFIVLLTVAKAQFSPTWLESPYVETKDVDIITTSQETYGTFYFISTYTKSLSNTQVSLAIQKIKVVSNSQVYGFLNHINFDRGSVGFTHVLELTSPTQISYLRLRYMAYDGDYERLLPYIQISQMRENSMGALATTSASARTVSYTQPLAHTLDSLDNEITISAFLTGFLGTATDFLGANITATVLDVNNLNVDITVNSNMAITEIIIYFLVVDHDGLALASWTFVQTTLGKSSYGTQYTYFTPVGSSFFDDNYIAGLASFSLRNNYHFNLTISNITFSTTTPSKYDEVSFFSIYIRLCESPTTYYNKDDGLCYASCPGGTYPVTVDQICEVCDYTCNTCSSGTSCDTCVTNRVVDAGTGLCECIDYYYEHNKVCIACHYSCLTCQYSGQYFDCLSCDPNMLRSLSGGASPSTCDCDAGYEDVGVVLCEDICGDGDMYVDGCDDGGTVSGDGCSSNCQVENYYFCTPNISDSGTVPTNGPSACYYIGNVTISISRIQKSSGVNKATFYLDVSPYVPDFSSLTLANFETNLSSSAFTLTKMYMSDNNQVVLEGSYSGTLEGTSTRVTFKPSASGVFSEVQAQNTTFVASADNGMALVDYSSSEYKVLEILKTIAWVCGLVFLLFAIILCLFDWKELGTELLMSVQFMFYSLCILESYSPTLYALAQAKYVMGYNDIGQVKPPYLSDPQFELEGYSVNFQYNFNIMAVLPVLCLIMYGIYRLLERIFNKQLLEEKTSSLKFSDTKRGWFFSTFFKFDMFTYWMFFCTQQILVSLALQVQKTSGNEAIFVFIVICLVGILAACIGVVLRPNSLKAYREALYHKSYGDRTFILYLASMLLMNLLLLMAFAVSTFVFYVIPVLPLLILILVVARRPFKLIWNNVRLAIIELCLLVSSILTIIMMQREKDVEDRSTFYFPIAILCLMVLCLLVTVVVWVMMLVKKIRQSRKNQLSEVDEAQFNSRNQDNKKQRSDTISSISENQDEEINEKVREAKREQLLNKSTLTRGAFEMSTLKRGNSNIKPPSSMRGNKGSNFRNRGASNDLELQRSSMARQRHQKPLDMEAIRQKRNEEKPSARSNMKSMREFPETTQRDVNYDSGSSTRKNFLDPKDIISQQDQRRKAPRVNRYQDIINDTINKKY